MLHCPLRYSSSCTVLYTRETRKFSTHQSEGYGTTKMILHDQFSHHLLVGRVVEMHSKNHKCDVLGIAAELGTVEQRPSNPLKLPKDMCPSGPLCLAGTA